MTSLEKPPCHICTHASKTNHADLHSVFLLRNRCEDSYTHRLSLPPLISGYCLMRGGSQTLHGCDHTVARTKNGRPSDQHVGPCTDDLWRWRRVDAPSSLEVTPGPDLVDHLAPPPNLGQRRVDERLMAKARID